jgi:hypothetical protein
MVNDTPDRVEREPRDWRTEEEARIDTIRSRLSDRDLRFLFELVSTEAWREVAARSDLAMSIST